MSWAELTLLPVLGNTPHDSCICTLYIWHSQYLSISLTFTHISPLLWSVLQKTNSQADSNFRSPLQKSKLKKTKWWTNCLQYLCCSHNCNGWNLALITPCWPWVTYHVWPLCDSIYVFNTNPWSNHFYVFRPFFTNYRLYRDSCTCYQQLHNISLCCIPCQSSG